MIERIEVPNGRSLFFGDFWDAAAWLDAHRDEHPGLDSVEWRGTNRQCIYDAATGILLARGRACPACRREPCPKWDWAQTAAHDDFLAAVRRAGAIPSALLIEAAAELAEFAPDMSGDELFVALRDAPPVPAGVPLGIRRDCHQQAS